MEEKLYVGNLSYNTTEPELSEYFSQAGAVRNVMLIKDRETGRSKGFAFVEMDSASSAQNAIQMFNGKRFQDRELTVNVARPREDRPRNGGFGGGPRGGPGGMRPSRPPRY